MQSGLALPCYAREGELPPSPALHPQNQQQRKNQEQQQNQNQNQEQQQNQGRLHRRLDTPREGAYMLRTNLQADSAEQMWSMYMQLTEAEASFRALKSEFSIRPLFHQKEPRVKAHILVAFLGYALWVTLKHLLRPRPAIVPQPSEWTRLSHFPQ